MKKTIFFILLISSFFGQAQTTAIPDPNFEQELINLGIDKDGLNGKVLTADVLGVTYLQLSARNIVDLKGIEDFKDLVFLNCESNKLTSIDISQNTSLGNFFCSANNLTSLDVSKNTALTVLAFDYNRLTSLDVSKNISLTNLICVNNQLTSLDISKNSSLIELYTSNNQLTNLDVSKNKALSILSCRNNKIASLDLSENSSLKIAGISGNLLTNIDISKNLVLSELYCNNNDLSSLNLKNGSNTRLGIIDLTSNPNLACILVDDKVYSDTNWSTKKDPTSRFSTTCNPLLPIILSSTGNQVYCPKTNLKIVTAFDITHDPSDLGAETISVQISSGFVNGQDVLRLSGSHPTITTLWDATAGKLTLSSPTVGTKVAYADFIAAIKDVTFSNSSAAPSGNRSFSISLGQANYLPSTQHYYLFVPDIGITWTDAKVAAETSTYFGLQGYLATLTTLEEAKFAGEQASGAGWIGGSDATTPDVWEWVTGPEAGTVFWNGKGNGSTPNFAYWNKTGADQEPNDYQNRDEKYAHITAPGVGITGSWNDLPNGGDADVTSPYHPKGYVVEYGGTVGDPPAPKIATSTSITIPTITATDPVAKCDSGSFTLEATTTGGTIDWYDQEIGGTFLQTGTTYTTPTLTTTTSYYVQTTGCTGARTKITATINTTLSPPAVLKPLVTICGPGTATLEATTTAGVINWYDMLTGGVLLATGTKYEIPNVTQDKTYYAESKNGYCTNPTRVPVAIKIYIPPTVTDENDLILCELEPLILDAKIAGLDYLWSTGEMGQTIEVKNGGEYSVKITTAAPESCSVIKKFTVTEHFIPKITTINVDETTITINLEKLASYYEYSINGEDYQTSNVFYEVLGGLQKGYVRDTNCSTGDEKSFVVLATPKFFTPNNDGFNDVWEIKGLETFPQATIAIFDRYGKLLKNILPSKPVWDGTFNKEPLPATDYWYILKIDNSTAERRGHFSLKR
jgi:gliding motility-associated-like protein